MATAISVRIPAGKLGTVRVDRTVDVYSATVVHDDDNFNATSSSSSSSLPTLAMHRQLTKTAVTASPTPLIIDHGEEQLQHDEHSYVPITKWIDSTNGNNNNHHHHNDLDDEQMSDIAVIYSVVRPSPVRRTSSPKQIVPPTLINLSDAARSYVTKSYTLEAPLTPVVIHTSKHAQIKTLSSARVNHSLLTSVSAPASSPSYLNANLSPPPPPSIRIQTSTSFTSHDRPSIPSVAVKPRPYSFRSAINPSHDTSAAHTNNPTASNPSQQGIRSRRSFRTAPRNAIERQISNLTGRVSQLHDSFLARLSDFTSSTSHRQRNRSLTSLHSQTVHAGNLSESEARLPQNPPPAHTRHQRRSTKPRPKSETFDDHHRVNPGKDDLASSSSPSMGVSYCCTNVAFVRSLAFAYTIRSECDRISIESQR